MELGDKLLRVRRASIGMKQAAGLEMGVNAMSMLAGTTSQDMEGGRVLQLLNMVTPEELLDNDEYEGMCSLSPCSPSPAPHPDNVCRDLPGYHGGVREVWRGPGDEGASTEQRQPPGRRHRQDLCQVCRQRIGRRRPPNAGRQEVRRSHRRHDVFLRGETVPALPLNPRLPVRRDSG